MSQADSSNTTDPSAPTTSEMDAMRLERRRAEQDEADRRSIALHRRFANSWIYGEAA